MCSCICCRCAYDLATGYVDEDYFRLIVRILEGFFLVHLVCVRACVCVRALKFFAFVRGSNTLHILRTYIVHLVRTPAPAAIAAAASCASVCVRPLHCIAILSSAFVVAGLGAQVFVIVSVHDTQTTISLLHFSYRAYAVQRSVCCAIECVEL